MPALQPVRSGLPAWTVLVLVLLFAPLVLAFEPVFGQWAGVRAAGAGVVAGLLIALMAQRWRWDLLSVTAAVLVAHFALGGAAALPSTTRWGVVPTGRTLQFLVLQVVHSWKDLLTLAPPASAYDGPAVLPWVTGLVCATAAGVLTLRHGQALLGTVPMLLMAFVATAWGVSGSQPALWPVLAWFAGVLIWWSWAAQRRRFDKGLDIRVGRRGSDHASTTGASASTGISRSAVHGGTRVALAALTVAAVSLAALPATSAFGPWQSRTVLRDLVDPPLDVREYPTPLSAFRHYTTDLENEVIMRAKGLPENTRVRIGVMDTYDGKTLGIAPVGVHPGAGFVPVGDSLPARTAPAGSTAAQISVEALRLVGPWVPTTGVAKSFTFSGPGAELQQDGLHYDMWADAALTTGPVGQRTYILDTVVPPNWSDGQLAGVEAVPFQGSDTGVPSGVSELAAKIAAKEQGALNKARAIERHLSEKGFFSNEGSGNSWAGHRADRLQRMIDAVELIGDDEQYAVLMTLMLHSQGINARVVMGAYPGQGHSGDVELKGLDMHAWVEVEFAGVGWAVFDPTPPRDQTPQTQTPKPRSIPRPQVLQPPEPPEEPAELPPATSQKGTDPSQDEDDQIPWLLIGGVGGISLLLLLPVLAILAAKARLRSRRRNGTPASSIAGSWAEVVDMAADAGVKVAPDLTRQEAAWLLTDVLWRNQGRPGTKVSRNTARGASEDRRGQHLLPAGMVIPRTVVVAMAADRADFAEDDPSAEGALNAWFEVDQLRGELRRDTSWWASLRRALSLKALRRRRRARREARKDRARRAGARELDDAFSAETPQVEQRGRKGRRKGARR
ncbi:transglutaminase domain-containing protein [Schaalia sp. 19OD2882]|nr:transglutaminase domain-containing protein [Schaalia sp. 19OD2882]